MTRGAARKTKRGVIAIFKSPETTHADALPTRPLPSGAQTSGLHRQGSIHMGGLAIRDNTPKRKGWPSGGADETPCCDG
jgi:hypothetical protein